MRRGFLEESQEKSRRRKGMKKGLWKRRAFAFLVAAAMVIPQGVYAAETGENEASENAITEEVLERVHEEGCILAPDHEGNCVTTPTENVEETQPEKVHVEGCLLAPDHEGDCVTEQESVHEDGCTLAPDHEGDCVTAPAEKTEDEQPEREHEDGCILPSDHEGECEVEEMPLRAPKAGDTLTVGENGDYDSLAAAVAVANKSQETDITIELLNDIDATECARITDEAEVHKNITINGNGHTITREEDFQTIQDTARSTYNPAMIEVTTPKGKGASLTLENITLNDAGKYEGKIFAQASDGEDKSKNSSIVQDAIVAAYGTDTATAEIILGEGAVLKNFGGMSAVRVTGGATLTMESGSKICDDTVTDRIKGDTGSNGPAGAVWVQGTHVDMEKDAKIYDVTGRAFYVDGGSADIDGIISNIKADKDMWQGMAGIAVHLRGKDAASVLDENCTITEVNGEDSGTVVQTEANAQKLILNGRIENCKKLLNVVKIAGISEFCSLNGTVQNCTATAKDNGYIIAVENAHFIMNGTIDNNNSSVSTVYAAAGSLIDVNGIIQNNTGVQCGGIHMYGNYAGVRDITVNMYDTAKIVNNTSSGGFLYDRGGAICSGGSSHGKRSIFTMYGGLISGNNSMQGAVFIRKNGEAYIKGGEISNNNCAGIATAVDSKMVGNKLVIDGGNIINNQKEAIKASVGYQSIVNVNGGMIYGNGTSYQISASGGSAKDANENIFIAPSVLQGNKSVKLSAGTVTLDQDYTQVYLGKASNDAKTKIDTLIKENPERTNWSLVGSSALWIKPQTNSYHFKWQSTNVNAKGLYVAYIPVNADGTPEANAELKLKEVPNETIVDITLDELDPMKAYAVMLVNNDTYVLTPEDITIYTGGDKYETTHGLPEDYTLRTIGKISSIKVGENETKYNIYNDEDQRKALEDLKELLNVSYVDDNGVPLKDDRTAGDYTAKITYVDPANEKNVKINGNNVKLKDGKLIIRYIEDEEEAIEGESVILLKTEEPTELLTEHAVGVAVADSEYYINNDEDRKLTDDSLISLLDDGLLLSGDDNRQELMEQRANEIVKPSSGMKNVFKFHYLDLVDPNNGNAWVSSSKGTIVYLPYPEGTDQNTDFTLLHYNDLHREYGINGQENVENAIKHSRIEKVDFTKETAGIRFKVEKSGFSPFAIIWEEKDAGDDGSSSSGGSHTSNTYYVRYHNDDETEKDGKFIPGETVTVKGNVFTAPVGKVLAGWSLEEDGKVDYKVGDTFRMPGSSVDLYAVWKDAETESHSAYISGYPDGTVGPDKTITRAEAATMFYNLLADKTGDAKTFTDVPANQWYAKAVMTLAGKGVISGYPDGTFKPDASITRAEFVTMAMNFANAEKGTACSFPDVPQNMWYYGAIAGATQNGWISGYPDGTFGPDRYITCAEVTSVINRMENRAADMSFMMDHLDELRTFSDLSFGHWAYGSMMEAANGHDYTRADQNSYESWVDIH